MYSPFYLLKHVTTARPATETWPSEAGAVKTLGWQLHKAAAGTFEDFYKVNSHKTLSCFFFLLFLFLFFMSEAPPEDPAAVSALIGSQSTSHSRSPSPASSQPHPPSFSTP